MPNWKNFFVSSLSATGADGHINAIDLPKLILSHDGKEAYHCAFDLEPRDNFNDYKGHASGALGYVWFDFDSKDVVTAHSDARQFVAWLGVKTLSFYSGSKGFHVAVPMGYFGLLPSKELPVILNSLAKYLKKNFYPTLDTTIYNPNRKFRVPGSLHPKTGLYKRIVHLENSLEIIKSLAKERGPLDFKEAPTDCTPLPKLTDILSQSKPTTKTTDSISIEEWRRYKQPRGEAAFSQCLFLAHAKDNPSRISEPEWYAAASVIARFENGRTQFHAISKTHPSYSKVQTDEKLDQALQASGPRTCIGIDAIWGKCSECPLFGRIKSPVVIMEADVIPTEATGFYTLMPDKDGQIKRLPNYSDLLKAYKREHEFKVISEMKTPFVFEATHYVPTNIIEVKAFAENKFEPDPKEAMRTEFAAKVMANNVTRKKFFIDTIENKINFKNGILNSETGALFPHSAEIGFRWVLPYAYDLNATAPIFRAWLDDIMFHDAELISVVQEFMGYVVRGGDYKYHKALWLAGSGRNGKSTMLYVLKSLIGMGNYSTLSIKQIIHDRFAAADLDGKIANFSEETSPEELSDSSAFKNLTGDGETTAQRKYGDPYTFANRAKLIMTYNEIPVLKDLSVGMLSRPIIIPFKKDLSDESKQDKNLKAKLLEEMSGIFNFAWEGWKRLEQQEHFSSATKSQYEVDEIREVSDAAFQWFRRHVRCTNDTKSFVSTRECYAHYKATCDADYPLGMEKFSRRLKGIKELEARFQRIDNERGYSGVQLISDKHAITVF